MCIDRPCGVRFIILRRLILLCFVKYGAEKSLPPPPPLSLSSPLSLSLSLSLPLSLSRKQNYKFMSLLNMASPIENL